MKTKRRLGKLALNRETLRRLSHGSLELAAGGVEVVVKTLDNTCNPSCNEYTCYMNMNQTCKNNCTASNPCCFATDPGVS